MLLSFVWSSSFLLSLLLLTVFAGECDEPDSTHTHLDCGELLMWEDHRSPASTVIKLALPESLAMSPFSLYISTCHEETTGSSTKSSYFVGEGFDLVSHRAAVEG